LQYGLTLLFKKPYIEQIISGEKTVTRRVSRPMVKVGGIYHIRTDFFNYLPDQIMVKHLYQKRIDEMTPEDALKEGASSLEEFHEKWTDLYNSWDERQLVWVVEFEYLGSDRKP